MAYTFCFSTYKLLKRHQRFRIHLAIAKAVPNGKIVFLHFLGLLGIDQPISQKMQNTLFTKESHRPLLHLLVLYLLTLLPAKLSQQPWIILPLGKDRETDWKTHFHICLEGVLTFSKSKLRVFLNLNLNQYLHWQSELSLSNKHVNWLSRLWGTFNLSFSQELDSTSISKL